MKFVSFLLALIVTTGAVTAQLNGSIHAPGKVVSSQTYRLSPEATSIVFVPDLKATVRFNGQYSETPHGGHIY